MKTNCIEQENDNQVVSVHSYFKLSTEDELMTYLQMGNRDAFNEIYDRTFKFLYNVAYNYTMNGEDTETIVVNVLYSLWYHRERHRGSTLYAVLHKELKYELALYFEKK